MLKILNFKFYPSHAISTKPVPVSRKLIHDTSIANWIYLVKMIMFNGSTRASYLGSKLHKLLDLKLNYWTRKIRASELKIYKNAYGNLWSRSGQWGGVCGVKKRKVLGGEINRCELWYGSDYLGRDLGWLCYQNCL